MGIVMLTTIALEEYIKKEIDSRLGEVNWNNIYFKKGYKNSIEGTYIYSKISGYHILYVEKGEIREQRITLRKETVLLYVLEIVSFDIALNYAKRNRKGSEDFRKELFTKEIEIYSLFGTKYEKKKKREIDKILEKNPYNDVQL